MFALCLPEITLRIVYTTSYLFNHWFHTDAGCLILGKKYEYQSAFIVLLFIPSAPQLKNIIAFKIAWIKTKRIYCF